MRKLFEFIRSIYVVVLFLLLELAAVSYYAHSSYYTQARLLSRSNQLLGGVHTASAGVKRYFSLGRENDILLGRVAELEQQLAEYTTAEDALRLEDYMQGVQKSPYRLMTARIVSNTINRTQNFLVLNKGRRDSVADQMAVLSPDGAMVGYVVDSREHYSVALSVLNTSFRASGKLVGTDYFGSVYWDGHNQHEVIMDELSKYADPKVGQEVVTAGFSVYFPADVLIGWVESAELNETRTAFRVRVRLAAEVSRVGDVILVENRDLNEVQTLLESDKVKQQTRQ